MVNLIFFLKFKAQLRRTRPDIVRQIDDLVVNTINDSGGKITVERYGISALLNEDTIGFWLDIYILIESLKKIIESSSEFFGYSIVISASVPPSSELLCRFLANHCGVFADEKTAKKLLPYASFEKPMDWSKNLKKRKYGCYNYYKLNELRVFETDYINELDIHKDVIDCFRRDKGSNVLVFAKSNLQRCGLYKYCRILNDDFPPLTVCFESLGIGALVDIWSANIRSLGAKESAEEIDNLWEFLFRERVRDEVSEYVGRCTRRFLTLVFDYYASAALIRGKTPILLLENVHLAENNTMNLLIDVLTENNNVNRKKLLILGTAEDVMPREKLSKLGNIFDIDKRLDDKNISILIPRLSDELWEIIYAISVLSKYFSPELFLQLFEEEEKNSGMIAKAFSILNTMGIIDSTKEPRLMNKLFEEYAIKILDPPPDVPAGEDGTASSSSKTDRVKTIVRSRLINWAVKRNLNPCFRLLAIIASLGGVKQIDDMLLLKALTSDIINKTITTIEATMNNGQFEELLTAKAAVIRHIYKTSRALFAGTEKEIEKAFTDTKAEIFISEFEAYPVLNAQIVVNFCCYYLGKHDEKEAIERAKEAILLGQNKNSYCLPQSYRLFALVSLSKQQINETIEYLGFALASAEKIGNYHEHAITAYYAAAVQFLYGDIYNASRLARKSIEQSLAAGHPDWADRSRFLEGRLEFELGHYKQALEIFEELRRQPYGSNTNEKYDLLSAWIYRSGIYLEKINPQKPERANFDADLFEIEAEYLSGNYEKAIGLAGKIKNPFEEENFLYTEKADWRSGFAQCEQLYFTHGETLARMVSIFQALSMCRLSADSSKPGEEALYDIQKILRDEKLCEIDPWDSFYFYSKYRILEQTGASLVDLSTAISLAFKRLQRRAGRIEDVETRRQYMNGSKWNRELSLAAKDYKLI